MIQRTAPRTALERPRSVGHGCRRRNSATFDWTLDCGQMEKEGAHLRRAEVGGYFLFAWEDILIRRMTLMFSAATPTATRHRTHYVWVFVVYTSGRVA